MSECELLESELELHTMNIIRFVNIGVLPSNLSVKRSHL